jgi:hypothetical protein
MPGVLVVLAGLVRSGMAGMRTARVTGVFRVRVVSVWDSGGGGLRDAQANEYRANAREAAPIILALPTRAPDLPASRTTRQPRAARADSGYRRTSSVGDEHADHVFG